MFSQPPSNDASGRPKCNTARLFTIHSIRQDTEKERGKSNLMTGQSDKQRLQTNLL